MRETSEASSSPSSSSFASLLAALALPPTAAADLAAEPDEDLLADDVAVLSYEQALRAHTRFRAPDAGEQPRRPSRSKSSQLLRDKAIGAAKATGSRSADDESSRKSATITVRLSKMECAQLRERAAAAGLTASAYLRSCIFDVETLRTQVKEALSKFQSATTIQQHGPDRSSLAPTWRARLFPRWSGNRRAMSA